MTEPRTSQSSGLEGAVELALRELRSGPPSSAFGIAREDCALVHMDYFFGIQMALSTLAHALAESRGTDAATIVREFGPKVTPCDCRACAGEEAAAAARERHRAAYTKVLAWVTEE